MPRLMTGCVSWQWNRTPRMVRAVLYIQGLGQHLNYGEWQFQELPRVGDLVHIVGYDGQHHYSTVRQVLHSPVSAHKAGEPTSLIKTVWKESLPADDHP